jgi:hypothetical protein
MSEIMDARIEKTICVCSLSPSAAHQAAKDYLSHPFLTIAPAEAAS